ncbi:MAG TPA: RNA polymerase sigma factor [Ktedonobacterales bacterium]|nr:RNA polymerase sigma factor [Ktedonobacterales bacterium]
MRDETHAFWLEHTLRTERARLVRWCAYLTGNHAIAEDLAQETCAAAWRTTGRPERAEDYGAWLAGIARNVCRSWRRSQRRAALHVSLSADADGGVRGDDHSGGLASGADDLQESVERQDLALLLDRALAFLPAETRAVLVAKYLEEEPLAQVAARMGLSESALAARLLRGKRALRVVLATQLRDEAVSFGLAPAQDDGWRETRIWCPECGARRLTGRLAPETDTFALRCPQCYARDRVDFARWCAPGLFLGLSSPRAALSRLSRGAHQFYRRILSDGVATCVRCGASATMRRVRAEEAHQDFPVRFVCARCEAGYSATLSGILLCHPQAQRFWRDHPRMTTLPGRTVASNGQVAALTSFVSRDGAARLDFISDPRSFAIWDVVGGAANTL